MTLLLRSFDLNSKIILLQWSVLQKNFSSSACCLPSSRKVSEPLRLSLLTLPLFYASSWGSHCTQVFWLPPGSALIPSSTSVRIWGGCSTRDLSFFLIVLLCLSSFFIEIWTPGQADAPATWNWCLMNSPCSAPVMKLKESLAESKRCSKIFVKAGQFFMCRRGFWVGISLDSDCCVRFSSHTRELWSDCTPYRVSS